MTDKEKDLLLKDLSARFPYGVKCEVYGRIGILDEISSYGVAVNYDNGEDTTCRIECVKPYLFPLSSMTDEQKKEYASLVWFNSISEGWHSEDAVILEEVPKLTDFYHKNHFDYRGLIPKGLAIDCTNLDIY